MLSCRVRYSVSQLFVSVSVVLMPYVFAAACGLNLFFLGCDASYVRDGRGRSYRHFMRASRSNARLKQRFVLQIHLRKRLTPKIGMFRKVFAINHR